jgi:hypothetical protein
MSETVCEEIQVLCDKLSYQNTFVLSENSLALVKTR